MIPLRTLTNTGGRGHTYLYLKDTQHFIDLPIKTNGS